MREEQFRFEDLIGTIQRPGPFVLTRWGDGEFSAILTGRGRNCDGVRYSVDMQDLLRLSLSMFAEDQAERGSSVVRMGLQPHALRTMGPGIRGWISGLNSSPVWHIADPVYESALRGDIGRLTAALRASGWIMVGPKILTQAFGHPECLSCHPSRAWDQSGILAKRAIEHWEKSPESVITLSAGPASNWMAWAIWALTKGSARVLDLGSVLDPWAGRRARKYQKRADMVALNPGVV